MKKATLYFLAVSMLILGVAGTSFAHWSKVIFIEGQVESGTVDWEWGAHSTIDPGTTLDYHCGFGLAGMQGWYQGDKHVGTSEIWVDQSDPRLLHISLDNVYPCYFTEFSFYPMYTGSVPGKINHVVFKDSNGDIIKILTTSFSGAGYFVWEGMEIHWGDNFGAQMHAGDTLEISFWIHILEEAVQDPENTPEAEYEFTIEMYVVNWNEYPVDPQWWIDNPGP